LLFYTNGVTVWNKSHAVMQNGTELFGDVSSSQSALIVRMPASANFYYIFTQDGGNNTGTFGYSVVDMNLAAGMGSVTTKNVLLHNSCTEKLTATPHCNNLDIWIVVHESGSASFRSYRLTYAGVNPTATVSSVGSVHSVTNTDMYQGCMKLSPNGKKLIAAYSGTSAVSGFELFDFNNVTGVVSNPVVLENINYAYGCEFSPDGSKLYGSNINFPTNIFQWDLCTPTPSALVLSRQTIWASTSGTWKCSMQLAPDGKIYVANSGGNSIGVISDPNLPGMACNYADTGLSVSPNSSYLGLPNMITGKLSSIRPFSFTTSCQTVSFATTNASLSTCAAANYSFASTKWNFGDASTGAANTSTLSNPTHSYSAVGTYTAQLVLNYPCFNDTIRQVIDISIASPTLVAIANPTAVCAFPTPTSTLSASGLTSYTWSTGLISPVITVTPFIPSSSSTLIASYTVTGSDSSTGCFVSKIVNIKIYRDCYFGLKTNESIYFSIYPNPTTGTLFIETEKSIPITVYNNLG
jgi:hypothetical protein